MCFRAGQDPKALMCQCYRSCIYTILEAKASFSPMTFFIVKKTFGRFACAEEYQYDLCGVTFSIDEQAIYSWKARIN